MVTFHWHERTGYQRQFIVLRWGIAFFYRFDVYGIYVVMFLEILRTLVRAIMVFSILFVAFGLAFYILMATEVRIPCLQNCGLSVIM